MDDRLFKLGTTSFIIPDHIIPNVKKLGPFFDEIELLIFESQPKNVLPSRKQVDELLRLSSDHNLTYNIHLPVDVSLSFGSLDAQKKASQTLVEVLGLLKPLQATTHTLHLEMPPQLRTDISNERQINEWKQSLGQRLDDFLAHVEEPEKISIETLDYSFFLIEDLIQARNLPVCIDIGHAIKYGYNWMAIFQRHDVPLVHLHGVDFLTPQKKDHTSLDRLPEENLSQVLSFLKTYTGVVSLEVFSLENLNRSLRVLAGYFKSCPLKLS
ncbi:MAG: cobamide remodeling phosphodiesterase CbiR [Pseudomonadota bacterium]